MKKIYTKAAASILAAAVLSATGISALAADESYGWQSGKAQYESRHKIFTEAVQQADDDAREAFFAANGIGGDGPYSDRARLDVEKLVEAGVIDQETAEEISQYVSDKQVQRHTAYAEKSSMTNDERHSFYTGMHTDHAGPIEELLEAGIISQEQADAIEEYLG